jgi:osmotically inducible lipoprotein OsmB
MNSTTTPRFTLAAILTAVVLSGCSGLTRNEITGAGVGGVAGAVLTGGSPTGAAVGAAVGGVVGNQVDKTKK